MNRYVWWGIVLVWVLGLSVWWQWPDETLMMVFCDVGQGDGVLLQQGFNQVVIDGGKANGAMIECLSRFMPFWDRHINLMVMSHPDSDHFGGLLDVVERYEVEMFLAPNAVNQTEEFWNFYQQVIFSADRMVTAIKGQRLMVGGIVLDVLWPEGAYTNSLLYVEDMGGDEEALMAMVEELEEAQPDDVNDASVGLWVKYGHFDGLFLGDAGIEVEKELALQYDFSQVEVLKVGHHGSKTSSSQELVDDLSHLGLAVVSVGAGNSYGHPDAEVLKRFGASGYRILSTAEVGSVRMKSDGVEWWVVE